MFFRFSSPFLLQVTDFNSTKFWKRLDPILNYTLHREIIPSKEAIQ